MTPSKLKGSFAKFRHAVRADYNAMCSNRMKYHGEDGESRNLTADAVKKIGFQMMVMLRVMTFFDDAGMSLVTRIASRFIRHFYGAEIHWEARVAPGVCIVHGLGLVISHAAEIGEGCILFQNVTLGMNRDRITGERGAPRLGRNVHVGPGATLLGPIEIGDGSKIMAGVVLTRSIPPGSIVASPEPVVTVRPTYLKKDSLSIRQAG